MLFDEGRFGETFGGPLSYVHLLATTGNTFPFSTAMAVVEQLDLEGRFVCVR